MLTESQLFLIIFDIMSLVIHVAYLGICSSFMFMIFILLQYIDQKYLKSFDNHDSTTGFSVHGYNGYVTANNPFMWYACGYIS